MVSKLDLPPAHHRGDVAEVAIATVAGLALAVTILYIFAVPVAGKLAANRDFLSYWATGLQLVHHHNPYDRDAIWAIEHSAGLDPRTVLIMRNPPWALPLAYPLGLLGLRFAGILWSLLLLTCLLVSIRILHKLHGSPPTRIHWLGFAFTPAIICFTMGQTTLLALLGLVLFLRFHRCHPFNAGAALWLCALKPHLFLPFAAVLAAWIVLTRAWKLLAGFAVALAFTSALATLIDPSSWTDYARLMRSPSVENQFIPCLAGALRHWLRPHSVWIAIPSRLSRLPLGPRILLAPPRSLGLALQLQLRHPCLASRRPLPVALRPMPRHTRTALWRLFHPLPQRPRGSRFPHPCRRRRNLFRQSRFNPLPLDHPRLAPLVPHRPRYSPRKTPRPFRLTLHQRIRSARSL